MRSPASADDAGAANSGTTRTGTKVASSTTNVPRRHASRHCQSSPRLTSCRRATSTNFVLERAAVLQVRGDPRAERDRSFRDRLSDHCPVSVRLRLP